MSDILVLLSGGMDSATALALAARDSATRRLQAVSFNYGQRHSKELNAAMAITHHYSVPHHILDLRSVSEVFKASALTGAGDIPEGHYEDETMKKTVVPNRNMIMLSLATGLAISNGFSSVVYAAHAGDHAIYPDCRPEFAALMGAVIRVANYDPPELRTPFIMMSKADIARVGDDMGVPFEKTWSCYKGGELHCGKCGTCVERIEAFQLAGVFDPTVYEHPEAYVEGRIS